MSSPMMNSVVSHLLSAAGATELEDAFTYHDYLYELLSTGSDERPVTEQQWEMICDLQGKRRLIYSSTVHAALKNIVQREPK